MSTHKGPIWFNVGGVSLLALTPDGSDVARDARRRAMGMQNGEGQRAILEIVRQIWTTTGTAAGMEEPVMLPPWDTTNPFAKDAEQPDYVIKLLLVYYTPGTETFARLLVPTQRTRVILEAPRHAEMAEYSVMITMPGEVSDADKTILRARHIAVVESRDGMTIEQVIQETIAQWQGRSAEEIGRVRRVTYEMGKLGIYL